MKEKLLAIGATILFSSSNTIAADVDGIWFGGYAKGRSQITLQADFIENLAKFELEMEYWEPFVDQYAVDCVYYAEISDDNTGTLHLNAGASHALCEREAEVSVDRVSKSKVSARLSGLGSIPDFELEEVLRPIDEIEYATLPDNFDILGITLGQTRPDVEKNLVAERGYVHLFDRDRTAKTSEWSSELVTYRKGEANEPHDIVTISYSAVPSGASADQSYAVIIGREANLGKESTLHMDVLRTSLNEKYGAPTNNDNRRYGRNGSLVRSHFETSQFCEQGNRQSIQNEYKQYPSHCGSELIASIDTDRRTGMVTAYTLNISSVDWLNNDFWVKLGTERAAEFRRFLDTISQATTSGPEL